MVCFDHGLFSWMGSAFCVIERSEREIFVNDRGEPGPNYARPTSYN